MNLLKILLRSAVLFIFLATWLMSVESGFCEKFYVSLKGNDNNPGTIDFPFATITQARDAVRKIINKGLNKDIIVYIKGGIYSINAPIIFGLQDSGGDEHSITYTAYKNEVPIISGGKIIDGWKKRGDGLWGTKVSAIKSDKRRFRELFVNSSRVQRARHPNKGYFRVDKVSEDRMTYFSFEIKDIPESVTAEESELVFIHDWSISRIPVHKINHSTHQLYPISKIGRQHQMMVIDGYKKHPRYFLENHTAFCDAPGEWCFDSNGEIIYYPRQGETIEGIEAIAPVAEKLLVVRGDTDNNRPVHNLHFKGLVFEHCAYDLSSKGYAGVQATFHSDGEWDGIGSYVAPAIQFEFADNCSFENGIIQHVGGSGIAFGSCCKNCSLTGSIIRDVSGNGVIIGEGKGRQIENKQWWQVAPGQSATGNLIKNNLIENCGVQFSGAVGIWIGFAAETIVAYNEIRNLPYTGISVGWIWNPTPTPCKKNMIEHNHIHHVMQVLSDGGGIYTLDFQPGTVVRGNHIHDVPINLGRAESNGMFLDEGTTAIIIEKNVIYNVARSPIRFHRAGKNIVRNNVLAVKSAVAHIRYNNTNPKDIKQIENEIVKVELHTNSELAEAIKRVKESAGIELQYRSKFDVK